ncbi:transglutaminase TgpA family protein [Thalassobacillus devorans]|uniref:transglutaminase TgpA family protein n=1 Tax=Thalassobacillus devorans TaxID=279813 RepID=UPI001F33B4E7|nr:transglutaminaseTgpA domain-containing protein [Thalassobacillus devorans]
MFWEWMRPLEKVTDTHNLTIFVIYAAFCFFISFLQVNWWFSMPIKFLGLVFILDGLFLYEGLFSKEWFIIVYQQFAYNFEVILAQSWGEMTGFFRSFLFLVLLWLMSYLLYFWFVVAKRIFLFVLMTFIVITVMDTFTEYNGQWAIVRTFLIALVALGVSSFFKEMEKEQITLLGMNRLRRWVIPMTGLILLSTVVGYAVPKPGPQWADPVPYLESAVGGSGGTGVGGKGIQKIGYGEDDSELGGAFIQDETPVFQAAAKQERYWRVETKNFYTGKGWENTLEEDIRQVNGGDLGIRTFTDEVETEEQFTIVNFTNEAALKKMVYPYGADKVIAYAEGFQFYVNQPKGEVETRLNGNAEQIPGYRMRIDVPSYEYDQLREAGEEDPEEIRTTYLQLPDNLPNRVRNLSRQIIKDEDNRYDAVKAIEDYFSSSGFEYNTKDVAVPGENDDYVDQFLFETQKGYCDNFSTSMVVMLRSVGIPARWVKGFTGGELQQSDAELDDGESYNLYQVTNGNAHSWVEVHFPGIGWVPFEPTKGFSNPTDFYVDTEESGNSTEEEDSEDIPAPEVGNPQQQMEIEENFNEGKSGAGTARNGGNFWKYALIALAVAGMAIALYITRFRWMSAYMRRKYKHMGDAETYQKAYQYLLKVLAHKGMKRRSDQTLREYARDVDMRLQMNDMKILTYHYERILYRNEQQSNQWDKVTELWENLINRALS